MADGQHGVQTVLACVGFDDGYRNTRGLNWRAAAALLNPPSITDRTMASRPFGVRGAFLWVFIWSLCGTLKLRNLSFLGPDQIDNLLKAHTWIALQV